MTKKLNFDPKLGFEDNYSGFATFTFLNLTYMVAAMYGLEVDSSDVSGAYLQSEMPKGNIVYYVEQPEGFKDPAHPDWVCMLNKTLYGVLIAGQRWNLTFQKFFMEELGFKYSKPNPNLYIQHDDDGNFCLFPTVVDDTLDVCSFDALREEIHTKLYNHFKWKNDNKCSWFLGYAVKQNANEITVDQCTYLETVLKSFEKYDVKLSNVLANTKLLSVLTEDEPITDFPYSSLVRSLNWLMKTRPEISFAVSQCSHYLHNHAQHHDEAALKVLGYLKKNSNFGLCFPKSHFNKEKLFVDAYANLSNANCLDDQKSSYGHTLRANGKPFSWCFKKFL